MFEMLLLTWVWMICGGFALYMYCDKITRDVDLLTALALVASWPWWLARLAAPDSNQPALIPIRTELKNKKRRK